MATDIAEHIGRNAKSLMELVMEIDEFAPEEDLVEVLIDAFDHWSAAELRYLFPALEQYGNEDSQLVEAAERRIEALRTIREDIHLDEGADAPYSELASKYVAGIKYHLIVDVEDIMPETLRIPGQANASIARQMRQLQYDDEGVDGDE